MTLNEQLLAELKMESANTRKMLERIPFEKAEWTPHEHSMSLIKLASHVAELPGWISNTLLHDGLDFATRPYVPFIPENTEALLAFYDKHVADATAALEQASAEEFTKTWTMRRGEQIMFAMPKQVVLRNWALSHMYHHRGQLSVYLRLLDVPVPGMYGPSYDDRSAMAKSN